MLDVLSVCLACLQKFMLTTVDSHWLLPSSLSLSSLLFWPRHPSNRLFCINIISCHRLNKKYLHYIGLLSAPLNMNSGSIFSFSMSETENREKETCATINVSNAETHTNIK